MSDLKAIEYKRFEDIKHINENGSEYWSARELAVALDYVQWRNFEKVIKRAMIACENSGHNVMDDFAEVSKIVEAGATHKSTRDYELSRYACYLIVQNGDPRKEVIALGQTYFAMFVGSLFLMATVLIIYYKQISEGYEDKARFEIMQKVGMSRAEVKKTIRSQVLMVFFIPLIMAAIHIVVSFRIIKMILSMLNLGNVNLFMWCTLGTVLVFCVIYAIVFAITERAYYKIVSIGNK